MCKGPACKTGKGFKGADKEMKKDLKNKDRENKFAARWSKKTGRTPGKEK